MRFDIRHDDTKNFMTSAPHPDPNSGFATGRKNPFLADLQSRVAHSYSLHSSMKEELQKERQLAHLAREKVHTEEKSMQEIAELSKRAEITCMLEHGISSMLKGGAKASLPVRSYKHLPKGPCLLYLATPPRRQTQLARQHITYGNFRSPTATCFSSVCSDSLYCEKEPNTQDGQNFIDKWKNEINQVIDQNSKEIDELLKKVESQNKEMALLQVQANEQDENSRKYKER
ncbi:hypothetical protein AVEN_203506-1 [Araneus ventricosus]|uniref:Uncharacterized protein n=1 Tax=Araneus ventricosus TaxID=182803 RepID=A0A4Y2BIF3_ARAVE|nr:hypothetical protein AVEN_203506-1 [Araneus ventricosus]